MVWGLAWVWKGGVYGYDHETNTTYSKISTCISFFLGTKVQTSVFIQVLSLQTLYPPPAPGMPVTEWYVAINTGTYPHTLATPRFSSRHPSQRRDNPLSCGSQCCLPQLWQGQWCNYGDRGHRSRRSASSVSTYIDARLIEGWKQEAYRIFFINLPLLKVVRTL